MRISKRAFVVMLASAFVGVGSFAVGSASAQLPSLPNDHLLGYKIAANKKVIPAGTAFPKGITRSPIDQLGSHGLCTIVKEKVLYNPANKNGEGIEDIDRHYVGYQVKCPVKTDEVHTYFDQLFPAGITVDVKQPRSILVPSGKSTTLSPDPSAPAAGTNHYLCYGAKGPKIVPQTVTVADQFGSRSFVLKKVKEVCNPADKDGNDPSAASDPDHYVCYSAKPAVKGAFPTVRTNNSNFGANTLAVKGELQLCIPAYEGIVSVCGNATVDPGEQCEQNADCAIGDVCTLGCTCLDGQCPGTIDLTMHAGTGMLSTVTESDMGWTGIFHNADLADSSALALSIDAVTGGGPGACGVATIGGIDPSPGNCRCAPPGDNRAICDEPFASDVDDCGGGLCTCYLAPPEPQSVGNLPTCVIRGLLSDVTGTWNVDDGSTALDVPHLIRAFVGESLYEPCPQCDGDAIANDGVRSGACVGGANDTMSCDANSTDATFPAPGGGAYSYDCFPDNGFSIGGLVESNQVLTTGVSSLAATRTCNFGFGVCPCGVCTADNNIPCSSDADCAAMAAGTCNNVNDAPEAAPNSCTTGICDDVGGEEGECDATGPDDGFCDGIVRANGEGFLQCDDNADCLPINIGADGGDCTLVQRRRCFLDPIDAAGTPHTSDPVLAGTACLARGASPLVEGVWGVPGPARIRVAASTEFRCAGNPLLTYPGCP